MGLPVDYDFGAVAALSTAEWTSKATDVPASDKMLQPLARRAFDRLAKQHFMGRSMVE